MGDRGNIVFHGEGVEGITFYAHWGGTELKETLKTALNRGKSRWDDAPYLLRIVFSEMIQENVLEEAGFGISLGICDNEHPIIHVDVDKNSVTISDVTTTFKDFITGD